MLTIRREQLSALKTYAVVEYERRMVRHIRAHYSDRTRSMDDETMLARIRNALGEARSFKIVREADVTRYIEYHFELGPDFAIAMLPSEARKVLHDERLSAAYKMKVVGEHLEPRLLARQSRGQHG